MMAVARLHPVLAILLLACSSPPPFEFRGPPCDDETQLCRVIDVCAGSQHSCAVTAEGRVACWGGTVYLAIGDQPYAIHGATWVPSLAAVEQIACGWSSHTCARTDAGQVYCWGGSEEGQTGLRDTYVLTPNLVALPSAAVDVAAAADQSCAVLEDGTVWCWGWGSIITSGPGEPVRVPMPEDARAERVTTGTRHACALLEAGDVACWGTNRVGKLTIADPTLLHDRGVLAALPFAASAVSAGATSTCAVDADGGVWCWGDNLHGQLGDLELEGRVSTVPVRVDGIPTSTEVMVSEFACAVQPAMEGGDASAWCWGPNDRAQLGTGESGEDSGPVEVAVADVRTIAGGLNHGCAVSFNGSVWCWGANRGGLGHTEPYAGPADQIRPVPDFVAAPQ